jgi:hypothetical protein
MRPTTGVTKWGHHHNEDILIAVNTESLLQLITPKGNWKNRVK